MTQEEIQNIVSSTTPDIIDQEAIPNTNNFRTLKARYVYNGGVLIETFTYSNSVNSDGWAEIKGISYSEGEPADLPVFRSWNISVHPQHSNVFRRVDLTEMNIDANTILLRVVVKHFTDSARTIKAPYSSVIVTMLAENDLLVDVDAQLQAQGAPARMGERAYWDLLTSVGYTPYNLLDQRIPQLDAAGRFNSIY